MGCIKPPLEHLSTAQIDPDTAECRDTATSGELRHSRSGRDARPGRAESPLVRNHVLRRMALPWRSVPVKLVSGREL